MKLFRSSRRRSCLGFSLVEAALSVSVLSFGFLSLAPLLGLGLKSARQARDHQLAAQIAVTVADQAREGTLITSSAYYDNEGAPCAADAALYRTTTTETTLLGNCTRLTIAVQPVNDPYHSVDYAVVLPAQ